jgi:hypothetical protein
MIKLPVLKGYVLEEALARLLANNGYRLLTHPSQDPEALTSGPHGLLVRGRGSDHQADVLGDLLVPVPFSLPVRLFVEAKYRKKSIGISEARNALGTIADVNEQYATSNGAESTSHSIARFHYRYSLFSTSGFTDDAQNFALAQQISLVDLGGTAFRHLRELVTSTSQELFDLANQNQISKMPISQVRTALRLALGTWTATTEAEGIVGVPDVSSELSPATQETDLLPTRALRAISAAFASELHDDLLLGFPDGGYVLVLRPDNGAEFFEWLQGRPTEIPVEIRFAERGDVRGDWVVAPINNPGDSIPAPLLRFGLPPLLLTWLLAVDGSELERARIARRQLL